MTGKYNVHVCAVQSIRMGMKDHLVTSVMAFVIGKLILKCYSEDCTKYWKCLLKFGGKCHRHP